MPSTLFIPFRTTASALLLTCLALPQAGCLVSSSNSTTESGVRVSNATLAQVVPGTTTESWVVATLGEPTSRTDVPGQPGTQILRYDFSRSEESSGAVFLIFGGSTRRQTNSRAFFEVSNGVVTRSWQEV